MSRTSSPSNPNQTFEHSPVISEASTSSSLRANRTSSPNYARPSLDTSTPTSRASNASQPSSSNYARPSLDTSASTSRASNVSQSSPPSFSRASSSTSSSAHNSSSRASTSSRNPLRKILGWKSSFPSHPQPDDGTSQLKVVGIKVNVEGKAFNPNKLLTGDIVESVTIEGLTPFGPHFTGGKKSLFEDLQRYSGGRKLIIKAKRQEREINGEAKLVKKNELSDLQDHSHHFTFEDYSRQECEDLQEEERQCMEELVLGMKVAAANVIYRPCLDQKIKGLYSVVVVPHWNCTFHNVDETVFQAMSWFSASTSSGVPLVLHNIQTEPFVLELENSADIALSSIASTGTYGLQQSRGAASLDVVRAIRVWFEFEFAEVKVELEAWEGEDRLGVGIERTAEGFCHVTTVVPGSAAERAGLDRNLRDARTLRRELVVTRVGNEKVLPWFISDGKIRCFDVSSIISILKAYQHARHPASLHILDIKRDPANTAQMPEESIPPLSPASVYNGHVK